MPSTLAKTATGIGRQAHIYNDNGHFAVQLHATVVYDETNEKVTLNNGGWVTPTTVRYMNQAIRYRNVLRGYVCIRKGVMCYGFPGQKETEFDGATLTLKI